MGISQSVKSEYMWVDKGELGRYKEGKINKLDLYCNQEFCPGVPKKVSVVKALKGKSAEKREA